MNTFGERLKALRKKQKLTRPQLVKMCGISLKTIQNYENGEFSPKIESAEKLAAALGTTAEYLLYGTEPTDQLTEPDHKEILEMASALFAGGELSEDEQLAFLTELQTIYLDSKKKAAQRAAEEKKIE